MTTALDGPRLAPASQEPARQLVVFAHGYGADGGDLIAIGREWARALPHAAFASPDAPESCEAGFGRQWFALNRRDPHEYARGAQAAAPALDAFLDAELARLGLDDSRLAIVGFSQGTMMALQVGLRRARPPAAIVGYSGLLAGAERLDGEIAARPPVLLVHGQADEVIPVQATEMAARALGAADVPVEWHVRPGLGHGIDGQGLAMGADFLARAFA